MNFIPEIDYTKWKIGYPWKSSTENKPYEIIDNLGTHIAIFRNKEDCIAVKQFINDFYEYCHKL